MPNWCSTDIIIDGPKEEILSLYDNLIEWENMEKGKELCKFLEYAGFDKNKYRCRGEIISIDCDTWKNNSHIIISTETAWIPMIQMWRDIVDRYTKDCEVLFCAEEDGNEIYETNDVDYKFFTADYKVRINITNSKYQFKSKELRDFNDYGECSFSTEEFLEYFKEEFNNPNADEKWIINKIKELDDILSEDDIDDQYIYVYEYAREAFLDID